jgi:outer membrane protein
MRGVTRFGIGLWLIAAGASSARAQEPLSLTVDDAIQRAVAQAPRLGEARSREAAAQATVHARAAAGAPTVTAISSYLRTNHVDEFGIPQANGTVRVIFPDIPDNYRARGELLVPIFTGGRVASAVASAKADADAAESNRHATEADVRLEAARAYWTLAASRANVTVLEQSLQRTDAWVGDVRARMDAGFLGPNDLPSAQAQRARQNVQLIQARSAAAFAELDLARLIGVPAGQSLLATTPVAQASPGAGDLAAQPIETLVARARDSRPERASLVSLQTSLRATGDLAAAAARPQVAGLAAIEPARPNSRFVPRTDVWKTSWDLGVNVNWPLWDGGRARADRTAALAQSEAVGHRLEEFDAQVALDIRQRVLDLESNRAALQAAGEYVAAATEARRVAGERFTAGVATSADVLDAQVALLEAELERIQIAASLRLGEARLLHSVGVQ